MATDKQTSVAPYTGSTEVPRRVDTTSALATKEASIIVETIMNLKAREAYLTQFIESGLDRNAQPKYSTQPAPVELDSVQESLRLLAFRLAYAIRGAAVVPPLDEFSAAVKAYDKDGRVTPLVGTVMRDIPEGEAKDAVMKILVAAGRALSFQQGILSFEGAKGFTRSGTPPPDRAYSTVKAKVDALRAARKTDPKATVSIRSDIIASAKEDPRWDALFDAVFARMKQSIVEYDVTPPGMTPAERLRELEKESLGLQGKASAGTLTDDDYDRILEIATEKERLTKGGTRI